jgi:hypothetical protein
MENFGIFSGHSEYLTAIWNSLLQFGKVHGNLQ